MPASNSDAIAALDRLLEATEFTGKERLSRQIERRLEADLAKLFRQQGTAFVRSLARIRSQFPAEGAPLSEAPRRVNWDRLLDAAMRGTRQAFVRVLGRAAREAMRAGARRLAATLELAVSLSLRNPRAEERIRQIGAERVRGIEATTRETLRALLTRAVEGGWSYTRTSREIRATFGGFSKARAHRIAVTETADAYEWGRRVVVDDLQTRAGIAFEKSWLTAGDRRVDPVCSDNEAAGWIGGDSGFPSGHDTPPAHPECRCVTLYRPTPERA